MDQPNHLHELDELFGAAVTGARAYSAAESAARAPYSAPSASQVQPHQYDLRAAIRPLGAADVASPPWLLGPCIMRGDCVYIVGEGGAGKSTLCADLLTACMDPARESALAGAWRVNRDLLPAEPKALIINAETSLERAWELHLLRANVAAGHTPNSPTERAIRRRAHFIDSSALGITPHTLRAAMERLAAVIAEDGYSLVVIDPVYALFAPEGPGDDAWVTVGLKTLLTALKAADVTTIALAHPPESFGSGKATPSLKAQLKPYGSSQQKGQMDAHFGLKRAKAGLSASLIKVKDRRAYWLPPFESRLTLNFGHAGGGYSSSSFENGKPWEYENPHEFVLSPKALAVIGRLPADPWRLADVAGPGTLLRKATTIEVITDFLLPQQLVTVEQLSAPGAPKLYTWTPRGLRAHKLAVAHAKAND